jgi:head-tail adaptor
MTNSGNLGMLYQFQRRTAADDGFGTVTPGAGPWEDVFKAAGQPTPLTRRGGEKMTEGLLLGNMPYSVRIRYSPTTRAVDSTWRAIDREGKVYNVNAVADADGKRRWIDVVMTSGAAT